MFSNYLIGLREGLEASLVVCILIAYLVKTGRRDALKPVWTGIGVAVALALGFGCALEFGSQELTFEAQEALGGSLSILAVGLVTWMVFWMRRTARHLKAELHGKLDAALAMGTGALVATAFLAVGREGLETALFVWASVHAASDGTPRPLIGVALGIATAVAPGLAVLPGRAAHQPGEVLHLDRRHAGRRGGGRTRVRRPRPAGGRLPAGPDGQGLRHQRHDPAGQLVRHPAEGRLQLPARPDRRPGHGVAAVPGPDARAVPAPPAPSRTGGLRRARRRGASGVRALFPSR